MPTPGLTFGVLGAGRHAVRAHLEPLRDLGHRILVWDPDPVALERVRGPGIHVAGTEDEVLDGCDGLVVCSPDRFHTAALLTAVARNLPVLVDKPVAVTEDDLDAVRPLLLGPQLLGPQLLGPQRPAPVVSTCHPRRTDPPFIGLRAVLPELCTELGPVTAVEFRFDYPPPRAGQPRLHASLLTDHVGHELDLLDYLLGVPDRVTGEDRLPPGQDPHLVYEVLGERSDGIGFAFRGFRTDPARTTYDERLTLRLGDDATVTVGSEPGSAHVTTPHGTRPLDLPGTDYAVRFREVNADFAAAVAHGTPPYLDRAQIWRNSYATVELDLRGSFTLLAGHS